MDNLDNLKIKLSTEHWESYSKEFENHYKDLIQTPKGAVKKFKDILIKELLSIDDSVVEFTSKPSLEMLDEQINELGDYAWKKNEHLGDLILINFWKYVDKYASEDVHLKDLRFLSNQIKNMDLDTDTKFRINDLIKKYINQSLNQSRKSSAGTMAELITESLLKKIGLEEGLHFRKQFKSSIGSDTDFVFPYVEDGQESKVEIFCAVQMSTNDRGRMASSELKAGGEKYLITYNDFSFSTKDSNSISEEIVNNWKQSGQKLVANSVGMEKMIKESQGGKKEFYENYAISFDEFLEKLKKRYL